ncbi:hypothetical protein EDB84DRAFT_1439987 [Lactarius hengduanensis]|nr:hypothetical protein EDB84DRAFT_1439987 [Lactarius hengduanensis]
MAVTPSTLSTRLLTTTSTPPTAAAPDLSRDPSHERNDFTAASTPPHPHPTLTRPRHFNIATTPFDPIDTVATATSIRYDPTNTARLNALVSTSDRHFDMAATRFNPIDTAATTSTPPHRRCPDTVVTTTPIRYDPTKTPTSTRRTGAISTRPPSPPTLRLPCHYTPARHTQAPLWRYCHSCPLRHLAPIV